MRATAPRAGIVGVPRVIVGAAVAPGIEVVFTVPLGERWQMLQARAVLGTDATIVDRRAGWRVDDGAGNDVYVKRAPSVQVASTFAGYSLSPSGVVEPLTQDEITMAYPANLVLLSGWHLRTFTFNLQPGDQWISAIVTVGNIL
jgi:hypothetical protein